MTMTNAQVALLAAAIAGHRGIPSRMESNIKLLEELGADVPAPVDSPLMSANPAGARTEFEAFQVASGLYLNARVPDNWAMMDTEDQDMYIASSLQEPFNCTGVADVRRLIQGAARDILAFADGYRDEALAGSPPAPDGPKPVRPGLSIETWKKYGIHSIDMSEGYPVVCTYGELSQGDCDEILNLVHAMGYSAATVRRQPAG